MSFSLLQPLNEVPLAFFDVETTGASAQWGDRIIELGIVRVDTRVDTRVNTGVDPVADRRHVTVEYQQLLNPGRRIGAGITALTGITSEMVADQPTFSEVATRVAELLSGCVIIGHNVRFDLSFLNEEFRRCGREIGDVLGQTTVLDTVRIARKLFGRGGNGLQRLSRRLDVEPSVRPPRAGRRSDDPTRPGTNAGKPRRMVVVAGRRDRFARWPHAPPPRHAP